MSDRSIWVLCLCLCSHHAEGLLDKTDQDACIDLVKEEPMAAMHHCLSAGLRNAALVDVGSDKIFASPPRLVSCPYGNDESLMCLIKAATGPSIRNEIEIVGSDLPPAKSFAAIRRLGVGVQKAVMKSIESGPLVTRESIHHTEYSDEKFLSTTDGKFFFKSLNTPQLTTLLSMMAGTVGGKSKTHLVKHLKHDGGRSSFIAPAIGVYRLNIEAANVKDLFFALIPDSEMHLHSAKGFRCFTKTYDTIDPKGKEEFKKMRGSRGFGINKEGCKSVIKSIERDGLFLKDYKVDNYDIFFTYATGAGCNTDTCHLDESPGALQMPSRACMKVDHAEGPKMLGISLYNFYGKDTPTNPMEKLFPWTKGTNTEMLRTYVLGATHAMCPVE